MTHDPLCPSRIGYRCECDLIANVREDEGANVVAEFMSNHGDKYIREQAIRDCIAAVEAQANRAASWRPSDQPDDDYYKALDDALAALRALLEGTDTPPPLPPSVGIPEKKGSLW